MRGKVKLLPPVVTPKTSWDELEARIKRCLKEGLYLPAARAASPKKNVLKNSTNVLVSSIRAGHVRYEKGAFRGVFTAEVSRELRELGAVWDRREHAWKLRLELASPEVRQALEDAATDDLRAQERVLRALDEVDPDEVADSLRAEQVLERAAGRTDRDFRRSVREVAVVPPLSRQEKTVVAEGYSENLKRYVRDFTREQVEELRKRVEQHVFKGGRADELSKIVQQAYGVGKRKARFLARQETNLMTSKLKEARYASAGVDEYLWQSVTGTPDHPVRPMHKQLNDRSRRGEVFRFSDPPITSPTGARNNPGEDFNCRCVARPVVRFK